MPESAARRCRSQPKPSSATAQSSDGGVDLERRAGVADHDLAGEGEAAGIDFARAGGIGGAQVLRRDHQPVGLAEGKRPADERMRRYAAESLRTSPRARNTDSLVRSATETRDIEALAPLLAGVVTPAAGT